MTERQNMKMKKIFFAFFAAILITGCSDNILKSVHSHEFHKSFALKEGRTDSLTVTMNVQCPEDGLKEKVIHRIREQIKTAIYGENYTVLHVDDGFESFSERMAKEYRTTNLDILENIEGPMNLSWEYMADGRFAGSHKHYITYTVSSYTYTGGAHGMSVTKSYIFDMKSGETVEESEFFKDDYMPQLSALLTAHVKDNTENMTLFVSEVEPNGNFEVSDKGITYIYNPYEIAPYSEGTIRITVPWKELQPILK